MASPNPTELIPNLDVKDPQYDGVVVVTDKPEKLVGNLECLRKPVEDYGKVDDTYSDDVVLIHTNAVPSGRLIWSPTGPLNRDYDDVRRFYDAGLKGIKRALSAGCKKPLFVRPVDESFPKAGPVAILGALQALYVPLEIREDVPSKAQKVDYMGVWCDDDKRVTDEIQINKALEIGRYLLGHIICSAQRKNIFDAGQGW